MPLKAVDYQEASFFVVSEIAYATACLCVAQLNMTLYNTNHHHLLLIDLTTI